ncbi:WAT1-related protein At5g47470-like [Syzygium oleosum]|uniref:WAT1-related protein At5g47470-like n=1 Tax=Syzygium oleosum TaxID=219896 RepID=UPI0024BB5CCB|nr:WAT1-related protein At5g47470-like [Syzygium oleosum]
MEWYKSKEVVEEVGVIGGLIVIQFLYASNSVMLSYLMSLGLNPLTFVYFSSFATFLVLSPVAFSFERSMWPKKLSLRLMVQLVLISFSGVTLFQTLFVKGVKLTSPAIATAMLNLAPGLIFVIAWITRLEKVKLSCLYSKVKILGTVLCVSGAVTMSLCSAAEEAFHSSLARDTTFDQQKIIGCFYLIAAVLALSSNSILQAVALAEFPAPISMCAIMSLIGASMTAAVQLFEDHKLDNGWPFLSFGKLVAFSFLGGGIGGSCIGFTCWAIKKRGAVLPSMFNPIATICSVIYSAIRLGDTINMPSLAGMVLMFTGLYSVLWAKVKEGYQPNEEDCFESGLHAEKPLLS